MPMKRAALFALSLMLVGAWSQEVARGQSSAAPPVSLTPPNAASAPPAGGQNAKPGPVVVTTDRSPPAREPSPPMIGRPAAMPNPAADYDGFSANNGDSDLPSQVTPPARRTAKGSGLDAQTLVDREDEALKRKLTICQKCK